MSHEIPVVPSSFMAPRRRLKRRKLIQAQGIETDTRAILFLQVLRERGVEPGHASLHREAVDDVIRAVDD